MRAPLIIRLIAQPVQPRPAAVLGLVHERAWPVCQYTRLPGARCDHLRGCKLTTCVHLPFHTLVRWGLLEQPELACVGHLRAVMRRRGPQLRRPSVLHLDAAAQLVGWRLSCRRLL